MQTSSNTAVDNSYDDLELEDAVFSAVSWAAIFAGALTAVALSLVLLILGSGLGFAAMSPWSNAGATASALTLSAIVWLIVMQWASAGVGGYITGRLRMRWLSTHHDEVFFRDTAHGLLTWALASVVTAALFASVMSSIVGGAAHAAGKAATVAAAVHDQNGAKAAGGMSASPYAYYVDGLFRQDQATTVPPANQDVRTETGRILVMDLKNGNLPDNDKAYIAKLVSQQTGLTQDAAAQRVNATVTQIQADEAKAKDAADTARKASASFSIFTALSMFIGAFIACLAAALGGKCRDDEKVCIRK
jgi:hypothetical protein